MVKYAVLIVCVIIYYSIFFISYTYILLSYILIRFSILYSYYTYLYFMRTYTITKSRARVHHEFQSAYTVAVVVVVGRDDLPRVLSFRSWMQNIYIYICGRGYIIICRYIRSRRDATSGNSGTSSISRYNLFI